MGEVSKTLTAQSSLFTHLLNKDENTNHDPHSHFVSQSSLIFESVLSRHSLYYCCQHANTQSTVTSSKITASAILAGRCSWCERTSCRYSHLSERGCSDIEGASSVDAEDTEVTRRKIEMLDVMNLEFYKKKNHSCDLVAVSAGLRELCVSPSAKWLWPLMWGPGRDKHTDDTTHTHGRATCSRGQRHDEQQIKYLNHVNNFSAAVPQFEFPHISFHVLGDSHCAHLQRQIYSPAPTWPVF